VLRLRLQAQCRTHTSATPVRSTCVAWKSGIHFRLPAPCLAHPSETPARTPGAARTTETPVPHAHANPKCAAGIQLFVCTLKSSNDERSANIQSVRRGRQWGWDKEKERRGHGYSGSISAHRVITTTDFRGHYAHRKCLRNESAVCMSHVCVWTSWFADVICVACDVYTPMHTGQRRAHGHAQRVCMCNAWSNGLAYMCK